MSSPTLRPYIPDAFKIPEFTQKSVLMAVLPGISFGTSTMYLALTAELTASASLSIAVIAITLGRKFLGTTILDNDL